MTTPLTRLAAILALRRAEARAEREGDDTPVDALRMARAALQAAEEVKP